MRKITSEIVIAAPAAKVWQVITNFENWKSWNPIVAEVQGTSQIGSKLQVTMKGKNGGKGGSYSPLILESEMPKHFRWRGSMAGGLLMTNDKIFSLREDGGKTHLVHTETFSGLMVPLSWGKMEKWVPNMLESMNKALKAEAERS